MTRASDTARTLSGGAVFNEGSNDVDLRVESNGQANMLFVDGGNDAVIIQDTTSRDINGAGNKLQINHTDYNCLSMAVYKNAEDGAILTLGHSRNATIGSNTILQDGDALGGITFVGADGTDLNTQGARIDAQVDGTPGANDMPTRLVFRTTADGASSTTERMRIDSSGSVAIGSTSTSGADRLTLKGSTTDSSTNLLVRNSADTTLLVLANDKTFNVQGVYDQTTSSGANVNVASDGHIRRSTSSLRYKNTVSNAAHGLTELLTLRPVTYKGNNDGDTVFGGLIAEEVHDAGLTEFVQYDDDGQPDALAYGNMVSLCIKAIQELKTELDEAKARITALENAE